jgi:hypothetical protein
MESTYGKDTDASLAKPLLACNGVNNLDQLRVTYKKYRHQLSVTNGVRGF